MAERREARKFQLDHLAPKRSLAEVGVPPRYFQARLADFQGFAVPDPIDSKDGFSLFGPSHIGKTHFLCGLAYHLSRQGKGVRFWNVPDLLDTMRDATDWDRGKKLFQEAMEVPYLLLDDLTACRGTGFAVERLYLLVNGRWNREAHTSISGNDWDDLDPRLAARFSKSTVEVTL